MKRKDVFEGIALILMLTTSAIQFTGGNLNTALGVLWLSIIAKNVAQWED